MIDKKELTLKWSSWCDEIFKKANDENRAIFILIQNSLSGLSLRMQEKVLQNPECIEILNANFICIKVDSDERPDLDKYYQKAHLLLNSCRGGWPLTLFCTPQNRVFFANTYMELESKEGSIEGMGFLQLIKLISAKVTQNNEEMYKNAKEIEGFLKDEKHPKQATVLKKDFLKTFISQAKNNYDAKNGGFSTAPKFPHANTLSTLLYIDNLYNNDSTKEIILNTLNSMKNSAIYDSLNGGFYRYTTDSEWKIPQFEKSIYDNALLCELYSEAYLSYKDKSFLKIAKEIANFWCNSMSEKNLFYTANSAYIKKFNKDNPFIDKKIQTSLSSMMIKALFILGDIDDSYKQKAIESLESLLDVVYIDSKLYHIINLDKKTEIEAFLEDYAFLAQTLITAFNSTKDEIYLIRAQHFTNIALEKFYKNGVWNYNDGEFITKADISDNKYTSAVATIVDVLISLNQLINDNKYNHFVFKTLEYNSYEAGRRPVLYPAMLRQILRYLK
jgi:uncharacterized protein YyaL (SSP411 family)